MVVIYNIGYFLVGGYDKTKKEDKKKLNELIMKYNSNYNKLKYDDHEFLSLNK